MDRFCPEGQKLNPWQWAIGIKSQDPALNATSSYPCGHGRNHIPTHHLFYAGVNSRYMYIAVTLLPLHSRYRYSVVKHFTVI